MTNPKFLKIDWRKIVIFVILSAVLSTILFCNGFKANCTGETTELESVEIKEYQGERLSFIYDFRENSIKGPQHIDKESYMFKITGLVDNPKNYAYSEVINSHQNYKKVVILNCVEGWSVKILWEGVLVRELINEAKPLPNSKVAIFHAYDGYTTSFPLSCLATSNIIMAYKINNVTLPPERGFPFQLVAESKWGYKWIKWITEIELSDNINYKGYWESSGYYNSGNLNESFIEGAHVELPSPQDSQGLESPWIWLIGGAILVTVFAITVLAVRSKRLKRTSHILKPKIQNTCAR